MTRRWWRSGPPHGPPCELEVAHSLGIAGFTLFPEDETKHGNQSWRNFSKSVSIYKGVTADHIDTNIALNRYLRLTFFGDESGLLILRDMYDRSYNRRIYATMLNWMLKNRLSYCTDWFQQERYIYKAANGGRKASDKTLRPRQLRPGDGDFPTLAFEIGSAEKYPILSKEKDWWMENYPHNQPQGGVEVVILITFDDDSKVILLERWNRGQETHSQGVIIKPSPETVFKKRREVEEIDDVRPYWVIEGAPLQIKFEDVYLRPAKGHECDLILDEKWLFYNLVKHFWYGSN